MPSDGFIIYHYISSEFAFLNMDFQKHAHQACSLPRGTPVWLSRSTASTTLKLAKHCNNAWGGMYSIWQVARTSEKCKEKKTHYIYTSTLWIWGKNRKAVGDIEGSKAPARRSSLDTCWFWSSWFLMTHNITAVSVCCFTYSIITVSNITKYASISSFLHAFSNICLYLFELLRAVQNDQHHLCLRFACPIHKNTKATQLLSASDQTALIPWPNISLSLVNCLYSACMCMRTFFNTHCFILLVYAFSFECLFLEKGSIRYSPNLFLPVKGKTEPFSIDRREDTKWNVIPSHNLNQRMWSTNHLMTWKPGSRTQKIGSLQAVHNTRFQTCRLPPQMDWSQGTRDIWVCLQALSESLPECDVIWFHLDWVGHTIRTTFHIVDFLYVSSRSYCWDCGLHTELVNGSICPLHQDCQSTGEFHDSIRFHKLHQQVEEFWTHT